MRVSARNLLMLVAALLMSAAVTHPASAGDTRLDRILQQALVTPPRTTRVIAADEDGEDIRWGRSSRGGNEHIVWGAGSLGGSEKIVWGTKQRR